MGRARVGAGLCPEQRALCRGAVWGPRLRTGRSPSGSGEGSQAAGTARTEQRGMTTRTVLGNCKGFGVVGAETSRSWITDRKQVEKL